MDMIRTYLSILLDNCSVIVDTFKTSQAIIKLNFVVCKPLQSDFEFKFILTNIVGDEIQIKQAYSYKKLQGLVIEQNKYVDFDYCHLLTLVSQFWPCVLKIMAASYL